MQRHPFLIFELDNLQFAISAAVGADFILYGPIDDARVVFPAVAMVDTAYSQLPIEKKIQIPRTHPRYRIG